MSNNFAWFLWTGVWTFSSQITWAWNTNQEMILIVNSELFVNLLQCLEYPLLLKRTILCFSKYHRLSKWLRLKDWQNCQNIRVSKYKCPWETRPAQLKVKDLSGLFLQLTIEMIGCILDTLCHRIFLQMKQKWTRKNNEDVDEQDARQELWDKIVSWECSREVLKSFRIDGKVHLWVWRIIQSKMNATSR